MASYGNSWMAVFVVMRTEKAVLRDASPPSPLWQGVKSPSSALFLCKGPALVPIPGTGQGDIPSEVEFAQLGAGVGVAAGTTEEIAQREQPVSRCHRGCLWLDPETSLTAHEALSRCMYSPPTFRWLHGAHSFTFAPFPLLHF